MIKEDLPVIYIAGPMRGYEQYNFPKFMEVELALIESGWDVLNPAQADLDRGFDPLTPEDELTKDFLRECMTWDVQAVLRADAICLLPGWEESKGANVELALADWLGLSLYVFSETDKENPLEPLDRSILKGL